MKKVFFGVLKKIGSLFATPKPKEPQVEQSAQSIDAVAAELVDVASVPAQPAVAVKMLRKKGSVKQGDAVLQFFVDEVQEANEG